MSLWRDIQEQSAGTVVKKEDQVEKNTNPVKTSAASTTSTTSTITSSSHKYYKSTYDTMYTILSILKVFLITMIIIFVFAVIWLCANTFGFVETLIGVMTVLMVMGIFSLIYIEILDY